MSLLLLNTFCHVIYATVGFIFHLSRNGEFGGIRSVETEGEKKALNILEEIGYCMNIQAKDHSMVAVKIFSDESSYPNGNRELGSYLQEIAAATMFGRIVCADEFKNKQKRLC